MVQKKLAANKGNAGRPDRNLPESTTSLITRIAQLLEPRVPKLYSGMNFGDQSGYVSWRFDPKQFKTIEILHLTDLQFGHIFCDVKRIIEYRDWVLSKPNRFVVFGGDMIDAGTKFSPGSPWEQRCEPQGEVYQFCELIYPLAHRVLGYVSGNHELRSVPTFGNLGSMLASILNIPFSLTQQRVDIHFGAHKPFSIRLWHGAGTSQSAGAKMNMVDRFMQRGDADLYLTGHLHDAMTKFKWREMRDPVSLKVYFKKIGGAMSSSFLQYCHTYAEAMNLEPNGLMMARAVLEADGGWELTLR